MVFRMDHTADLLPVRVLRRGHRCGALSSLSFEAATIAGESRHSRLLTRAAPKIGFLPILDSFQNGDKLQYQENERWSLLNEPVPWDPNPRVTGAIGPCRGT